MRTRELAFAAAGHSGRPMLLIHGWCCDRSHMRGLAEHFARTNRVFSIDLPGHGETPLLDDVPLTFDGFAHAVADFCTAHDLRDVILVGHSLGGVVAVHTAGVCPQRIAAVVDLDGALPLRPEALAAYDRLFADVRQRGFRAAVEPFVRQAYFLPREAGAEVDALVAGMLAAPSDMAEALLALFPKIEAAPVLRACRAPLLLIGSSQPRFDTAAVERLRPETWIARVAVSGHFLQLFALPQVVAMIEQFLAAVGAFAPSASGRE